MPVFDSEEQLYRVLQTVFDGVTAHPDNIDAFMRSNLVVRMNFVDPVGEVLLDGRQPPLEVFFGQRPGKANVEFQMKADLLHQIWLGEASMRQAFFSGRIKTKGNLMKALQLADLFRECERIYPAVVREYKLS